MAKLLDLLKNLFSFPEESFTRNNPVTKLDESSLDEIKTLLKKNKGFLPLSLETNLGSCTRIYDDGLYHGSGPLKSSGLWLAGVFHDKDGRKTFDIPLENFDLKTQEAVLRDVRQVFAVAQKQENNDMQKKADRLVNQLMEDTNRDLNIRMNNGGLKTTTSLPEKIFPTFVSVGEMKDGKIYHRGVTAVAVTVKDGKVLFYESEKDAKKGRNPHFFDALSLNDKKLLLDALVDSKVSDDIRFPARESYIAQESDFRRSFEQYKRFEEQSQGGGMHR